MDKIELKKIFHSHPYVSKLVSILKTDASCYHLSGLRGSAPAFITSSVFEKNPHLAVFILPEREEAAYFFNDLENICDQKEILFFPSSFKKSYHTETPDQTNILMRAETLSSMSRSRNSFIVVTYPDAVHEKVITRQGLKKNTVEAKTGEAVSMEFLTGFLNEYGFERTDFVYEPGQFSVRGGILDVFSYANELPYRIEFSGNTIESIRSFEPMTQLSEKQLHFITLIPNIQNRISEDESESFFSFIPDESILWLKEFSFCAEKFQANYSAMAEKEILLGEKLFKFSDLFDSPEDINRRISSFQRFEFGGKPFFSAASVFYFNQQPQPSFNKNFDLLSSNLSENAGRGIQNVILSDTAKQVERIYSIFDDLAKRNPAKNFETEAPLSGNLFSSILFSVHEGFIEEDLKIACYTDHQVFDRYHRFRLRKNFSRNEALTLKELYGLKPGDFITHIDHGIGKFAGLEKINVNGKEQEAIRLIYKDNDILYISIHALHRIARFTGKDGKAPVLHKLGSSAWTALKQKTKKKVKDIAKDLIALYAKRKAQQGFAFSPDSYLQTELEASFIYEDTPDQIKSTRDVKADMENASPMDRLICGDVGFGKTEIAIRAAFKAAADGKQVAMLVPTTILALQHFRTFTERLKDFPCTIDYLNRFKSSARQKETLIKLKEGKTEIIIGTHRLLSKDVQFKNLGLLILDEEQKFGVAAKEKIKALKTNVDTLTLTATPIPRTLQFSLMGARDLSIINTPPPNRYPVTTELHVFNDGIIRDAVLYEVSRGGQVFFIHNRVSDIHDMAVMIGKLCPGVKIEVGHGQMDGEKLEEVMMKFIEGETDVLVSTTIVESGLDISNANTILISQAQNFGLSDLHQMRGRVGRSNKKAFCYLLTSPLTVLTPEARQRLKAIEEFSDLGSGFNIAMRDLDIRGAGNLLGAEQSGFISEIGFEMYHKILDEAIQELKEADFKELFQPKADGAFVKDCQIESDLEILIPTEYVENISERLNLYRELDEIETEERLLSFRHELEDRFGAVPPQADELLDTVRLRWKARKLGIEKIILKNNLLKAYFVQNAESPFYKSELFSGIIAFAKSNAAICNMREEKSRLSLTIKDVNLISEANSQLNAVLEFSQSHASV